MDKPVYEIIRRELKPTRASFQEKDIWCHTRKTTTKLTLYKNNYPDNDDENYRVTILIISIDDFYMGQDYLFKTLEEAEAKYDEVKKNVYDKIPYGFTMKWLRDHDMEEY